jgi:acetamidase/formamidase
VVHFVDIGRAVESSPKTLRAESDFGVARTGLDRNEAYMLLSLIGGLRVSSSPRPVMATRLIVPEDPLRAAGWNGELP